MRQFHWIKNCLNEIKVYFQYIQNRSFKKILIIKGCMRNIYWQVRISRKYLEAYRTVKKFDSPFFCVFCLQKMAISIRELDYQHFWIWTRLCFFRENVFLSYIFREILQTRLKTFSLNEFCNITFIMVYNTYSHFKWDRIKSDRANFEILGYLN